MRATNIRQSNRQCFFQLYYTALPGNCLLPFRNLRAFFGGRSGSGASLWKPRPPWRRVWNGISQHKLYSRFYIHAPSAVRFLLRFAYRSPFQIQNHFLHQKRQKTDGCWHSSTGVSPRPMLMGAAHNALRAFNARVSLTLPVLRRPQAATLVLRPGSDRSPVL